MAVCAACHDDGGLVTGARSSFRASLDAVDFGRVYVGAEERRTVTLSAPGDLPVTYTASFSGQALGFKAGPASNRVAANGRLEFTITFAPKLDATLAPSLRLETDATDAPTAIEIKLSGTGVNPPDCEDGNGCTVDRFDLAERRCIHEAQPDRACDDLNPCTESDTCIEGLCQGTPRSCDDGNGCTDDVCDPSTGCLHLSTRSCDDDNPCTIDTCDREGQCEHNDAELGTICDSIVPCTIAGICVFGNCRTVDIPEGTPCDDGDPCTQEERCIDHQCIQPGYTPPAVGEVKFITEVGPLASTASENPIIDRDGTVFIGLSRGITAVDQCGLRGWTTEVDLEPRWSGAVALPGVLSVPVGQRVIDVDTTSGAVLGSLDLGTLFGTPTETTTTATTTIEVLDLAVRASGALIASVVRRTHDGDQVGGHSTLDGLLAEIDRSHRRASIFLALGPRFATRVAIDQDESILAVLREAEPNDMDTSGDDSGAMELAIRLGIEGLANNSWATSATAALRSDLAIGDRGRVFWSSGLKRIEKDGEMLSFLVPTSTAAAGLIGAPILGAEKLFVVGPTSPGLEAFESGRDAVPLSLQTFDFSGRLLWSFELPQVSRRIVPALDDAGTVFFIDETPRLYALKEHDGLLLFQTDLPEPLTPSGAVSMGLTPGGIAVIVVDERVVGVRAVSGLAHSAWPRHRRDNLSTGHR
ncbi:MAG: hypothetical protein IPK13_19990 [Deltaproteobacteria bacterium]|nr:hypothetical protein [Deltaproteobacteria bacterium]